MMYITILILAILILKSNNYMLLILILAIFNILQHLCMFQIHVHAYLG